MESLNKIFNFQKNILANKIVLYQNDGYQITYSNDDDIIIITHNNLEYKVKIVKVENDYFWNLTPYNNSSFLTNINNPNSFDMVLFAIKENDTLYKNK